MNKERGEELTSVPGIGTSIAKDLFAIGIKKVSDLKDKDPEKLFALSNKKVGKVQDRCLLYTFKCAVYFASTKKHDPEKLKWWNWSDRKLAKKKKI